MEPIGLIVSLLPCQKCLQVYNLTFFLEIVTVTQRAVQEFVLFCNERQIETAMLRLPHTGRLECCVMHSRLVC